MVLVTQIYKIDSLKLRLHKNPHIKVKPCKKHLLTQRTAHLKTPLSPNTGNKTNDKWKMCKGGGRGSLLSRSLLSFKEVNIYYY